MPPPRPRARRVQPAVPHVNLAFLPHQCDLLGVQGLSNVTQQLFAPPVGFLTANSVKNDDKLQEIIKRRVLSDGKLAKLRFALVDLTDPSPNVGKSKTEVQNIGGKLALPEVAGVAGNDLTKQGGLGSMAKLACMWAAFQLRFDVATLEKQVRTNDKDKLFNQGGACRQLWDIRQKPGPAPGTILHAANPKIELRGSLIMMDGQPRHPTDSLPIAVPDSASYPDLYRIFDVSPGNTGVASLSFSGNALMPIGQPGTPAFDNFSRSSSVEHFHHGNLTKARALTFWERLLLMIDASDNACAHACIENVGFLYIGSLLWQSGMFSPDRNGGLWEGDTHDPGGLNWIKAPVPKGDPGNDFITGTAASVAALLTAMAQNRLVNKESCDGMRFLTDITRPGRFLSSFFFDGLTRKGRTPDRCFAKVGIGTFVNDCAIIERTVNERKIRYVAAAFDSSDDVHLHNIIVQLDSCILENNGLKRPADP
jgi:hypothetical protein